MTNAKDASRSKTEALKRLGFSLAEFFNPRDWVPSIPLPPVGPWEPKGKGCMTLGQALRGFPKEIKDR